ncbi:MAG: minor capsid protein [Methanoregula sp.]|nr:minor capsid protein [Methanoregula sp.]
MISPAISGSRSVSLASTREEAVLKALIEYINQRTDEAKQNLSKVLSQLITTSYLIGGDKAAREIGHRGPLGLQGLDPIVEKLGTHLDSTFGNLSGELTGIIRGGMQNGWSYDHVQQALADKIKAGWGKTITFNSVGQIRNSIQVNPDGTMKRIKTTIERPVTLTADTYAETLARTQMKQAYVAGHWTRYQDAGCPGWTYISVADERTRPRHLALHGRVFLYGTPEESMAREVMSEYRCRCRPKAYFGDPKLDTPDEEYAAERKDWSTQTFNEWKIDKNMPLFLDKNPQNVTGLHDLAPDLADRMTGNDWQILAYQMGQKSTNEMVKDTLKTLDKNFFPSKKLGEYTFVHIQRKHASIEDFGISDVLNVRKTGERVGKTGSDLHILGDLPDGRKMHVVISEEKRKIVTAHITNTHYIKKLLGRVEKVNYEY